MTKKPGKKSIVWMSLELEVKSVESRVSKVEILATF